jgi:capsular polysaccharide transport system permease protein
MANPPGTAQTKVETPAEAAGANPAVEQKPPAKAAKPAPERAPQPAQNPKPAPASVVNLKEIPKRGPAIARAQRRHRLLAGSFALAVLIPALCTIAYMFLWAEPRFASTSAFSVRKEEATGGADLISGIPGLGITGGNTPDSDILFQFMQSQQLVELIDDKLNLRALYGAHHKEDPVFAVDPDASIERLVDYWRRIVALTYEPDKGLITVEVSAFDAEQARAINEAVLAESSALIDRLSQIARDDTIRLAKQELDEASEKLKETRLELAKFRNIEQIVDPTADVAGQMGLISALQQSLAEAMIRRDELVGTTEVENDPRLIQADRRIDAIRNRIIEERAKVGADQAGASGDPLSRVVGDYEGLLVDREFAEKSYLASMAAYDGAVAEARRKSRYLAVHIEPTLAQTAVYPRRLTTSAVVITFLLLAWALFMLIVYSIRDRR